MSELDGVSWARLVRDDETANPSQPGMGWHLWGRHSNFPTEMGPGFQYVAAEGPVATRRAEALHTVIDFLDWVWVPSVGAAYNVAVRRFGPVLAGRHLDWVTNVYNESKAETGALKFAAWSFRSRRIANVDVGRFDGTRTGWKRLT